MKTEQVAALVRELARVRRSLEAESPYGPAWAATSEWVDDLEDQIRDLCMGPERAAIPLLAKRASHLRVA